MNTNEFCPYYKSDKTQGNDVIAFIIDVIIRFLVHPVNLSTALYQWLNLNPFTADPVKGLHFAILV